MAFADKFTINQLSEISGLDIAFIRRCVTKHNNLFKRYISRGDNNSLLFNSEGLEQFKRVNELKQSGRALPEIAKYLDEQESKARERGQEREQMEQDTQWLEKYIAEKERRIKEMECYNERIIALEKLTAKLQSDLKLLPGGKTPEEIRVDWEREQTKAKESLEKENKRLKLMSEYENTSLFRFKKRKKIWDEIKSFT